MKVQIISDIHNNYTNAEAQISKEGADRVIFLGDYFDGYGDESDIETVSNTAKWLQRSTYLPNRLHLFGNHDIWYSYGDCEPHCSGNSEFKRFVIKNHFSNWNKLYTHFWLDEWVCTHAGLSNRLYDIYKNDYSVTELLNESQIKSPKHWLLSLVGEARGGIEGEVGGILWCDYDEFEDIPGIKQIFGHTRDKTVRTNGNHICLDTGGNNYAIWEDGVMTIK